MKLSGLLCLRSMIVCNLDPGQDQIHQQAELIALCRMSLTKHCRQEKHTYYRHHAIRDSWSLRFVWRNVVLRCRP